MRALPQPLEQFGIAKRDRGLQARAGLHPGQTHHRIDQMCRGVSGSVIGCLLKIAYANQAMRARALPLASA